jgi:hypothetical protein
MSDDDELNRLLREVDSTLGGTPSTPARSAPGAEPSPSRGRVASATRTGVVAGALCGATVGVATFLFAWLPIVENPISSGLGAFVGAFATGFALTLTRRAPV